MKRQRTRQRTIEKLEYQNAQMYLFQTAVKSSTREEKDRALEHYKRASDEYNRRIRR